MGRLTAFSEGRRTTGFRRSYADREFSPDVCAHDRRMDDALAAAYCDIFEGAYIESLGCVYEFEESKRYHEDLNDYDYANRVAWLRLSLIRPWEKAAVSGSVRRASGSGHRRGGIGS
ncbi:hypothetical protein JXA88_10970 [Candidatus Fermentibacteria bacterium]|nr:hypothetical protein [Candidatus Fermentibacteria bacterium]